MPEQPENEKSWRCRVRLCSNWSKPYQIDGIFETTKGNRAKTRLVRFDKGCLDCGRPVLYGYAEVPDVQPN